MGAARWWQYKGQESSFSLSYCQIVGGEGANVVAHLRMEAD
jgi:hypothetical protein